MYQSCLLKLINVRIQLIDNWLLILNFNAQKEYKMNSNRIYHYSFASVYPLYISKAENKGRTKNEVDEIIYWLTGHNEKTLKAVIEDGLTLEYFFKNAPQLNPSRSLIKGVVCGVRLEEIEDETTREIRYLDKLIDKLAKGKSMEKILRKQVEMSQV